MMQKRINMTLGMMREIVTVQIKKNLPLAFAVFHHLLIKIPRVSNESTDLDLDKCCWYHKLRGHDNDDRRNLKFNLELVGEGY